MKFTELPLKGAYLIEIEPKYDERGFFARTFCDKEFAEHGLATHFVQTNTSFNLKAGLIRGLHYQAYPHQETKLVRCTRGAIFDVLVDVREDSPTYMQWYGEELTADNGKMLYIPKNFAHGFQVLMDESEVFYMMDEYYFPQAAKVLDINDDLKISWPLSRNRN